MNKNNYGLFLHNLRNRLATTYLNIRPFYWVHEEIEACQEPVLKESQNAYVFKRFGLEEINKIGDRSQGIPEKELINLFNKGNICVGLMYKSEIAAYMFIEINDFTLRAKSFKLKNNEAYLHYMWTFEKFRGKNLAPYLRYHSYRMLEDLDRDVKYSVSDYFNKSSIKFKKKLNSKHLRLYVYIRVLKKFQGTFLLRNYY